MKQLVLEFFISVPFFGTPGKSNKVCLPPVSSQVINLLIQHLLISLTYFVP